ncbi:MAG: hypothetical protein IPP31_09985 [Chitinophagaceae bacterium]|nr:hypothetical protein [Chitinophagaceae bacterium]
MSELFNEPVNFKRILIVYGIVAILNTTRKSFVFAIPGLAQLFSGLLQMKLGFLFLILFYSFKNRKNLLIVLSIIIIEIVLSLFSYFSSFKDIIITGIVVISMFQVRLKPRESIIAILLGIGFMYSIYVWQSVKGDYRKFLSAGERSQAVVVSQEDALKKLSELTEKSNTGGSRDVIYETIDRIGYIEFFSQATDNVPRKISYENGKLWSENILHIFQPRYCFPTKNPLMTQNGE